jgi:hypothetical protein
MYNIPLHFVFLKSLTFLTFKGKVLFCNQWSASEMMGSSIAEKFWDFVCPEWC